MSLEKPINGQVSKQECIPVGWEPPTLYRTVGRSLSRGGLCQGGVSVQGGLCQGDPLPPSGQTPVKILPCPKLRLRTVITSISKEILVLLSYYNILSFF